jgi:uncharacterized protein (DUF58 family)
LILSAAEFRMVEGLRLNPAKAFPGRVKGERLTSRRGLSIEFSDYREYAEGDDLRHLDWNVLARLDTPIIKTYRDEEDLAVHLLIDGSASMSFGEPSKLAAAIKAAAAFAYVGLNAGDAIIPYALGRPAAVRSYRSRASYPKVCRWAQGLSAEGKSSLAAGLRAFASSSARAGLAIIITDGLDPDAASALRLVAGRGHELMVLLVLSDLDLDPDLEGDLRLLDCESGSAVEITANGPTMKEYRRRLETHLEALRAEAVRSGGRFALHRTSESFEQMVRETWLRRGWLVS